MNISKRNTALDITRIVAMFSVVAIHFSLNTGYYDEPMLEQPMILFTILRTAFIYCVPLFILLSGYLLNHKTLSVKYYSGITKTLGIYVLSAISCIVFKSIPSDKPLTFQELLFGILDFSGANYAWYIEMYIGLFLLIPFLNLIYHGLQGKGQKKVLIFTLISLTSLPTVLNIFNFSVPRWFLTPYLSREYQPLVPDWWVGIYPITYYMLGAYLKEFPLKLKKRYLFLLYSVAVVIFGCFNFYRDYGGYFSWGSYADWFGMQALILSVLMFSFLSKLKTDRYPSIIKKIFAHLSDLCLGAYLMSYIADTVCYAILRKNVPLVTDRMQYFIPTVLLVGVASLLMSQILNWIYKGIEFLVKQIIHLIKKKQSI
ncbi:MAG: acyltransferase family protein [Clostridia bacterium]|nr:acyltransferase family protein [Clostridia bacterium]